MLFDDQILLKDSIDDKMKIDPVFEERVYKRISDIERKSTKIKLLFNNGEADNLSETMNYFTNFSYALIKYIKIVESISGAMENLTNEYSTYKEYAENISKYQKSVGEREAFQKLQLSIQTLSESVKLTDEKYLKGLENNIRL